MRHLLRVLCATVLVGIAPIATLAAETSPALTIVIPVSLTNISRDFDSFSVTCQLQWSEPYKQGVQVANMQTVPVMLVNRGFKGNVTDTTTDANAAARAAYANCGLNLLNSTNPKVGYRPGVDETLPSNHIPSADLPVGAVKSLISVPLP